VPCWFRRLTTLCTGRSKTPAQSSARLTEEAGRNRRAAYDLICWPARQHQTRSVGRSGARALSCSRPTARDGSGSNPQLPSILLVCRPSAPTSLTSWRQTVHALALSTVAAIGCGLSECSGKYRQRWTATGLISRAEWIQCESSGERPRRIGPSKTTQQKFLKDNMVESGTVFYEIQDIQESGKGGSPVKPCTTSWTRHQHSTHTRA